MATRIVIYGLSERSIYSERSFECSFERTFECSSERSFERSFERTFERTFECSFERSFERTFERSFERTFERTFEHSNTRRDTPQYAARFLTTLAFHSRPGPSLKTASARHVFLPNQRAVALRTLRLTQVGIIIRVL